MLFKINAHTVDGEKEVFYYDNITNAVKNSDKRRLYFWTDKKFEGIKQPYMEKKEVFSPKNPLKKQRKLNALKIQLGLKCNYSCAYCSQASNRINDTSKYPTEVDVDKFFDTIDEQNILLWDKGRIELWGGEPLVYYKVLKYLIPKLRNRWKKAFISIVTNGSLLDKEKIDFFLKYNVHITISHDGPGFHLRNKDDPMNDPKMVEIWKYLLDKSIEAKNPMGFNVVISPANYDLYKIAEFFKKFDERVSFGFEGIVNYHSDSQSLMIFDKRKRDTLTQQIFEIITSQWDNPVWHSIQQRAIRLLEWLVYAKPANSISAKCESTSDQVLAVTLKGDVLSCQNCDPVEFKIGNIADYDNIANDAFLHWSLRPNCKDCFALSGCRGGCPYLDHREHHITCKNERLLWGAIFAGVWFHLTETIIDNIEPYNDIESGDKYYPKEFFHTVEPIHDNIEQVVPSIKDDIEQVVSSIDDGIIHSLPPINDDIESYKRK